MGITGAMIGIIGLQLLYLIFSNKLQERKRVSNGKPAKIHDTSMDRHYTNARQDAESGAQLGDNAFKDLTDKKNDEFVYIY